jgi:hypothetical protein
MRGAEWLEQFHGAIGGSECRTAFLQEKLHITEIDRAS